MNKRLSLKGNKLFTFLPSYLFTLKKTFILLLFYLFTLSPLHADEGMWTIYNLPNQVFETMQNYGFELTYDQLYKGDTSLKAAVVNFSGYCSGVVVSPDGLVFTNHHCGFEAIRSHSTVEHDYMLNGFYAKDFSEELPNKDMFVSFMIDQKDVTDKIIDAGFYNMSDERKEEFIDSLQQVFTKWVSLVVKPTTGCGLAKHATTQYSVSMPRTTNLLPTAKTTHHIIQSAMHR